MSEQSKSVLDNIPVTQKGFPITAGSTVRRGETLLAVVGNCPCCGAAVYGSKSVWADEEPAEPKYACKCPRPGKGLERQTK